MAFYDDPNCKNISVYTDIYGTKSGVFIYKNFVKPEYIESIEKELAGTEPTDYEENLIDWYAGKISIPPKDLIKVWEQISEFLGPDWVIHPQNNLLTIKPGDNGMFTHSDSPGKGACHLLSQTDTWSTCCTLDYGVVAYFGDFEGGEVFYPNIKPDGTLKEGSVDMADDCFEVKPERGDLVIHSAFFPYNHGVREVTSGVRYAFSNFCLKAVDNPGTFYNYGTPEWKAQIGNYSEEEITNWTQPLRKNPQFPADKIKEMRESGLKGEELAEAFFSDMVE